MKPYIVEYLDQSVARIRAPILTTLSNPVSSIVALKLPTGAVPLLHFGQGDGVPVLARGDTWEPDPPEDDGIYVSNPASVSDQLVLFISFAQGRQADVSERARRKRTAKHL